MPSDTNATHHSTNLSSPTHRTEIPSLEVAKAIMIGLVVLGHIFEGATYRGQGTKLDSFGHALIYSFHMPFYFLLSGYLFRSTTTPLAYLSRKTRHLLLPYAAWLVAFNLPAILGLLANTATGSLSAEKLAFYTSLFGKQLYGGNLVRGTQMVFWFPTCLFFTQQLAHAVINRTPNIKYQAGIAGAAYGLALVNQYLFPSFHLPLALNVTAGAFPYFLIGHALPKLLSTNGNTIRTIGYITWAIVLAGLIVGIRPLQIHMKMANYGVPILSVAASTGAFVFILDISKRVASPAIIRLCTPVAASAMTIMYLHVFFLFKSHDIGIESRFSLLAIGIAAPSMVHYLLLRSNRLIRPLKRGHATTI